MPRRLVSTLAVVLVATICLCAHASASGPVGTASTVSPPHPTSEDYLGIQSIAYNPARDEFLVVWAALNSNGSQEIFGRRLDATGAPIGQSLQLTSFVTGGARGAIQPNIAYNPATHGYVLVYTEVRNWESINAVPLDEAGVPAGPSVVVSGQDYVQREYASLTYNPRASEYLVTWTERNYRRIGWQRIAVAGTGSTQSISLPGTQSVLFPGSGASSIQAAYSPSRNEYLAVFSRTSPSTASPQVMGQRIAADGTTSGTYFAINPYENTWTGDPNVVWVPSRSRYMVLWLDASNRSINAREVTEGGSPVGDGDFRVSSGFYTGWVANPRLVYSPRSGEFAAFYIAQPDFNATTVATPRIQRFLADGTRVGEPDQQMSTARTTGYIAGAYRSTNNSLTATWVQQQMTGDPWTVNARRVELGPVLEYNPIRVRVGNNVGQQGAPASIGFADADFTVTPDLPAGLSICDDPDQCSLGSIIGSLPDDENLVNSQTTTHTITATGGGETASTVVEITRVPRVEQQFRPILRFDSAERWRPLDIESFFAEQFDTLDAGGATTHRVCRNIAQPGFDCAPLTPGLAMLRQYPNGWEASDTGWPYIDIHGDGDDVEEFAAPDQSCAPGDLLDCDAGPRSSIYWHEVGPFEDHPYRYLDYWFFYRYNKFQGGDHEADWEGVSIALDASDSNPENFAFAAFDTHGHPYRYLRDVLSCDSDETPGSCGMEGAPNGGQRVNVYVAEGSHASYPKRCDAEPCARTAEWPDSLFPEKRYNGQARWANDSVASALKPFLPAEGWSIPSAANWVDWPGWWGFKDGASHVESPGARGPNSRFWRPDPAITCTEHWAPEGATCDATESTSVTTTASGSSTVLTSDAAEESTARRTSAEACDTWMGPHTAIAICDQSLLRAAIRNGQIGHQIPVRVEQGGRLIDRAAMTRGLVQVLGDPVSGRRELVLRNEVSSDAVITVATAVGRVQMRATFDGVAKGQLMRFRLANRTDPRSIVMRYANGREKRPRAITEVTR